MRIKFYIFFIILFTSTTVSLSAQNFKGKISDTKGDPILGGTIFIKNTNLGIVCNEDGEFQTTLEAGTYNVEFRSMGYKSEIRNVLIEKEKITEVNIKLKTNSFELGEVTISNKEDPAYEIIRKAIAKAPYHFKRVNSFKAESYIKGAFELTGLSKMTEKLSSMGSDKSDPKLADFKEKLFLQESYNDIEFTAPNNYTQTVKAFSSTIPDDFKPDEALSLMRGSVYEERFRGVISPLNPEAFKYYKFRYEGFIEDGSETINKIKITAKYENPSMANGYIYIAEESWDVRNLELTSSFWGFSQTFNLIYSNIQEDVYMPSAYTSRLDANMMGVKGYFNYFASIKYNEIILNTGDNINKELAKKTKREFEIKPDTTYKVQTDSLATKRDSTYWLAVRNTPLSDREVVSYEKKDSIQSSIDSTRQEKANTKFRFSSLVFGGKVGGDSTKVEVKYGGLIKALGDYNFVDGFHLGQTVSISIKPDSLHKLTFTPKAYYTTARKDLIYGFSTQLDYAPMRQGWFNIAIGSTSEDFNRNGITRYDNATSSFFAGQNYSMLYSKRYLNIKNNIDIVNGLKIRASVFAERRTGLHNNTRYFPKIGGKSIVDNILFRSKEDRITDNTYFDETSYVTGYSIKLIYFPYAYYTALGGKKEYKEITSPVFELEFSQGLDLLSNKENSQYNKLQIGINQFIKTSYFSGFGYDVQAGIFIGNRKNVHAIDFHGFNTSNILWSAKMPAQNYMLLDAYEYSTNKYWIDAKVNYSSQHLLLKRLPFMQKTYLRESVYLKGLYVPNHDFYSEAGYALSLMGKINLGIFASFKKTDFEGWGIRLVTNLGILGK